MRVIIFSIILAQSIIADMMYTNLYDYTGNHLIYNIVYFTEGKSYFETAHMSSKPEKLLIYCDTHTFNICNRLTVADKMVNIR